MKSSLHFCQAEEINWSLKSLKSTSPPGGPDIVKMQRSPSDSIGQQHDTPSPTARGEVGAKSWVGEHSWKLSPGSSPINLATHETVETISWWSSPTFSHDISTQLLTNSVRYGACSMIHLHPKLVHVVFLQKQVERWVHQCPSKNIRSCRRNGKYYYPSIAPLHRCQETTRQVQFIQVMSAWACVRKTSHHLSFFCTRPADNFHQRTWLRSCGLMRKQTSTHWPPHCDSGASMMMIRNPLMTRCPATALHGWLDSTVARMKRSHVHFDR